MRYGAMPHLLGYARVSTADQNPDLQLDALRASGCYRLFVDTASGALDERPQLPKMFDHLRTGDTLVVWKLDRSGRSLRHLIDTVAELERRDVGFRSIQENIDTTSPGGKLIFHISWRPGLERNGRVERTLHILRTIDDEEFRRQQSRELNKGEAAHDLSRFLFVGKEIQRNATTRP